jgi:hypothetical protein
VSEYTLLVAFLLLISVCLFLSNASNVAGVWQATNSFLSHSRSSGQSHGGDAVIP